MTNAKIDLCALYLIQRWPELIGSLNSNLDEPIDSYWNGSHTWFTTQNDVLIEWRLHPVSNFVMPEASRPEELLIMALEGEVDAAHYWEGLEVFPTEEHDLDENSLSNYCESILGVKPNAIGYVDHDSIGNEYERHAGKVSIIKLLLNQLNS